MPPKKDANDPDGVNQIKGIKLPTFDGSPETFSDFITKLEAALFIQGDHSVISGNATAETETKVYFTLVLLCTDAPLQYLKDLPTKTGSAAIAKLKAVYASSSQDRQCDLQFALLSRAFTTADTTDTFEADIMKYRRELINISKWATIQDHIIRSNVIVKISAVEKFHQVASTALAEKIDRDGKTEDQIIAMHRAKLAELFTNMRAAEATAARQAEAEATAFAAMKIMAPKKCIHCGMKKHRSEDCFTLPANSAKKQAWEAARSKVTNRALAVRTKSENAAHKHTLSSLVVDSGASSTMVSSPNSFTDFKAERGAVTVATGDTVPSLGKGTIILPVKDNQNKIVELKIKNALLTPDIPFNLLSTNNIVRDKHGKPTGHSFIDGPDGVQFQLADGTIIPLNHTNGVTKLVTHEVALHSKAAGKRMSLNELHLLMGHLNFEQTLQFAKASAIELTDLDEPFCEACAIGKSTRKPVAQKAADRSERQVLLFHSDILPFPTPSIGGFNSVAVFILDKTRLARVYGLKHKNDVTAALKAFVADMKTYGDSPMLLGEKAILQTDSGTEYKSKVFLETCTSLGISVQYAPPKTQAKNSIVERFIRSLTETARTLLLASKQPAQFWFHALRHACLLRNIAPTKALANVPGGDSPYEQANGHPFNVSLLQQWGSKAYTHVEKQDRTRLEPTARPGIYVGHDETSSCPMVYHPDTKRTVPSYHVIFDFPQQTLQGHTIVGHDPFADEAPPPAPLDQADLPPPPAPLDEPPPPAALASREVPTSLLPGIAGETNSSSLEEEEDPSTMDEAMASPDAAKWLEAFNAEVMNLTDRGTYEVVRRKDVPLGTKVVGYKLVFKTKRDKGNEKKVRIVAKGFMENTEGQQTFAPVSNYSTIRTVLSLAAALDLELYQCDIKSAYLMAELPEDRETYMKIPDGLHDKDDDGEQLVWRLKKSLYGLASAGRLWSEELCRFMEAQGFRRAHNDPALYLKGNAKNGDLFLITTWVDDMILCSDGKSIDKFLSALKESHMSTSSHGELGFILNMHVKRDREKKTITLSQSAYIRRLLASFRMEDAKPALTPLVPHTSLGIDSEDPTTSKETSFPRYRELIGSLNYVANTVRGDISTAVSQLSRFLSAPRAHHWKAALHCLRYLKGSADLGITYHGDTADKNVLIGYSDSDHGGCPDTGRSTSGYVFLLNGAAISWSSQRQSVVAKSTAEAELMATCHAASEAIHLRMLLEEIGLPQDTTKIYEDNQPCIKISENPINSKRSKHIHVRWFFIREKTETKELKLVYLPTADMAADCLTKNLDRIKVKKFRNILSGTNE